MKEDIRYFAANQNAHFSVELAGHSWCDGSYRIVRRKSPIWVMEQVTKGTGTIFVDGRKYTASAGDIYLLPKGADHLYYSDVEDPWEKWFFNIRGEVCGALLESHGLTDRIMFPACHMEDLFRSFYEAACEIGDETDIFKKCALCFHSICMELHNRTADLHATPEAAAVKAYLDRNIDRLVSADELAKAVFRSPDYVLKLFKRAYGLTPYTYLLQRKIEIAQRLLRSTSLPVGAIAERLGYSDTHYFSGLFKHATGITPTGCRNEKAP